MNYNELTSSHRGTRGIPKTHDLGFCFLPVLVSVLLRLSDDAGSDRLRVFRNCPQHYVYQVLRPLHRQSPQALELYLESLKADNQPIPREDLIVKPLSILA